MLDLSIENQQDRVPVSPELENQLIEVALACVRYEGIEAECEVSVLLTDNQGIQKLNAEYRNKDEATDVLSFPQFDSLKDEEDLMPAITLGDIVISVERAQEQAEEFGHSFLREICYLTAHSMFHLFGYDHMEEADKAVMRQREEEVLEDLGITRD